MVLVDSSIYIELLRQGQDPVEALTSRYEAATLVSCGVVRCEVLRGVIRPKPRAYLTRFFDLIVYVPTDHAVWEQTEEMAWQLDRAGRVLPLTDILIAMCAMRAGAEVLTRDRHFKMIPNLRLADF